MATEMLRGGLPEEVTEVSAEARSWLFEHLLPLWSVNGRDAAGGFHDQLDDRGDPRALPKRCRVQARQVYVFAEAGRLGWDGPWRACVDHGLSFLSSAFSRHDNLMRCKVGAFGEIMDDTADNYDQAFMLFALAKAHATTADSEHLRKALALLAALRDQRAHPLGGFREDQALAAPLRANPHMHLLEAAVAWVETSSSPEFRALADEIATLCQTHFIHPGSGALLELFDADWTPIDDGIGYVAEPGHQFEWAWLLLRWHDLGGRVDPSVAHKLYNFAVAYGVCPDRNVAINEVYVDGTAKDDGARLWPQTERIKATLIIARDRPDVATDLRGAWLGLRRYALAHNPALFRDKLRSDGTFVDEASFASSLYHITCAIAELDRAVAETAPDMYA